MSMIMVRGGFNAWQDLLQFLTDNLQVANLQQISKITADQYDDIIENSILAISIIVEDCTSLFEEEEYVNIIEYMLKPVFFLLAPRENEVDSQTLSNIRAHAVNTINMLLVTQCQSVKQYMQEYAVHIVGLYQQSKDSKLKKRIVEGLTTILEFQQEVIYANLQPVLTTMVQALQEKDQVVGLAASEFWSGLVMIWLYNIEQTDPQEAAKREAVQGFLPQLLPILLECCRFADADKMSIIDTKESDLYQQKKEEEYDEEEAEEGFEKDRGLYNATLRKSACYTLGQFSKVYQDDTINVLFPYLEKALASQWEIGQLP